MPYKDPAANRASTRKSQRKRILRIKFGMTPDDLAALIEQQGGLCRICCEPMQPGPNTHIDHCHATGQVRGLLCANCNRGLGHFHDNPLLFDAAREYLNNSMKGNENLWPQH